MKESDGSTVAREVDDEEKMKYMTDISGPKQSRPLMAANPDDEDMSSFDAEVAPMSGAYKVAGGEKFSLKDSAMRLRENRTGEEEESMTNDYQSLRMKKTPSQIEAEAVARAIDLEE